MKTTKNKAKNFFRLQFASFYPPFILLSPLYLVLNFLIYIFSLSFLNCGSSVNNFSMIVISISLTECPFSLKWAPVVFNVFLHSHTPYVQKIFLSTYAQFPKYIAGGTFYTPTNILSNSRPRTRS